MIYTQNYQPLPWPLLSILCAAAPVLVLFLLLVVKRAPVPWAAAGGAIVAFGMAVTVYRMPVGMAGMAFVNGALFALLPICYVLVGAMLLYNITVETGCFARIKASVAGLSPDHRLQAVLIAFCFGAFLEGAAGAGTPVAICAAMLVGLGFDAFPAACLCLIANTSPVAYGGFGTPLLTLSGVTGLDVRALSHMAGNQLPFLSCIIPFWLVRTMCGWKETKEVWPAIAVAGGSFALCQFLFAHSSNYPLTDLAGGLISLVVTGVFLRYWQPKRIWRYETRHIHSQEDATEADALIREHIVPRVSLTAALSAWMPFILLCVLMIAVGTNKTRLDKLVIGPVQGLYVFHMPGLDKQVQRTPPVVEQNTLEPATFNFNWLTTPGTPVLLTVLIVIPLLKVTREQMRCVVKRTAQQMLIPIPTILCMIGLGYITRYAGLDATLGMAFKSTGVLYPFFAAILGWLGVFLTGTDAGSNALFGSLQKITAFQLGLSPTLICVANSSGGVMGKMIDAQSICVATAATERIGTEADIFKFVLRHSAMLAALIGLLVLLQAYVFPFTLMVPR
ncbi:MAG TPA: L-lactate permease [Chthonomonadaceae bacterium]|nr:L-lactate permease [Chthonomonadaceae bacterium]